MWTTNEEENLRFYFGEDEYGKYEKVKNHKIYWEIEQRSDEWFKIRENSCGGTGAYSLLLNGYDFDKQKPTKNYSGFLSPAVKWGVENEPIARDLFVKAVKEMENYNILECGAVIRDDIKLKCHTSPDGLICNKQNRNIVEGILEIKCYQPKHAKKILKQRDADEEVQAQIQWNMFLTESNFGYFIMYCPMLLDEKDEKFKKPLYIKKYLRNEDYINAFKKQLNM